MELVHLTFEVTVELPSRELLRVLSRMRPDKVEVDFFSVVKLFIPRFLEKLGVIIAEACKPLFEDTLIGLDIVLLIKGFFVVTLETLIIGYQLLFDSFHSLVHGDQYALTNIPEILGLCRLWWILFLQPDGTL